MIAVLEEWDWPAVKGLATVRDEVLTLEGVRHALERAGLARPMSRASLVPK